MYEYKSIVEEINLQDEIVSDKRRSMESDQANSRDSDSMDK